MIPHKIPGRQDLPQSEPVAVRVASEQRLNECGYLIGRYHVPENQVEGLVRGMSLATRTMLAMEMAEMEKRNTYVSEYDPFEGL
jgi:hypothetical protein